MSLQYILVFWWSLHQNPMAMHSTPDAITYATLKSCGKAGEKWLSERRVDDIQTRYAYSCELGNTAYMTSKTRDKWPK